MEFGFLENNMDVTIFMEDLHNNENLCSGQLYYDFLDYAFSKTDCFSLIYVNFFGRGYSNEMKHFRELLRKFKIKSRSEYSDTTNTTYKYAFYRNTEEAKSILKRVNSLTDWKRGNPQDLAFFRGDQCWFLSDGSECVAGIIHPDKEDIEFLISKGLSKKEYVYKYHTLYDAYDEPGLGEKLNRFKAK